MWKYFSKIVRIKSRDRTLTMTGQGFVPSISQLLALRFARLFVAHPGANNGPGCSRNSEVNRPPRYHETRGTKFSSDRAFFVRRNNTGRLVRLKIFLTFSSRAMRRATQRGTSSGHGGGGEQESSRRPGGHALCSCCLLLPQKASVVVAAAARRRQVGSSKRARPAPQPATLSRSTTTQKATHHHDPLMADGWEGDKVTFALWRQSSRS